MAVSKTEPIRIVTAIATGIIHPMQPVDFFDDGFFVGTGESTGITVNYQYNRYVSVYDGLKEMLKSVGYKMEIKYDNELKAAKVGAVPIVDYSSRIEYSSDMNAHYYMTKEKCGVNHLICLGAGELRDRVVVHLYADAAGNISQTQTFFGADEICDIYDYAGASREDLINGGISKDAAVLAPWSFVILEENV